MAKALNTKTLDTEALKTQHLRPASTNHMDEEKPMRADAEEVPRLGDGPDQWHHVTAAAARMAALCTTSAWSCSAGLGTGQSPP